MRRRGARRRKAPYSFATAASDRSEQPMREVLRMRGSGSVLPVADLQANACSDVYQLIVLSPTPLTPPPSACCLEAYDASEVEDVATLVAAIGAKCDTVSSALLGADLGV